MDLNQPAQSSQPITPPANPIPSAATPTPDPIPTTPPAQAPQPPSSPPPPPVSDPTPSDGKFYQSKTFQVSSIVGIVILVATGVLLISQTSKPEPVTNNQSEAASPQPVAPLTLTINSPTDETVVKNDTVTVKGTTSPNTTVAYFTDNDDSTADSDASGNFEGTIKLVNGINTLTVTAFGENGEEKTTTLTIVYDAQS